MTTKGVLTPKLPDERLYITADFTALFDSGITIASATITCTVYAGADPTASSMVSGGSTIAGKVVSQLIVGGLAGTTYLLKYSATGSDTSIIDIQLILPVTSLRPG